MLYGHERAERRIIDAWSAGRLHHAFLIAGPQGIGKATFAYRVARFLLRHPDPAAAAQPESLEIPETDMVARLVAARSHPDLAVVEPFDDRTKRIKRDRRRRCPGAQCVFRPDGRPRRLSGGHRGCRRQPQQDVANAF